MLDEAVALLSGDLTALDLACSRFRPDSEIRRAETGAGVEVSPLLAAHLDAALRAAELTDGLVDPTVGTCLEGIGYDRDLAAVTDGPDAPRPAPGWWRLGRYGRTVVIPRGVRVDLGSTAKALAADHAAARITDRTGAGVLVNLGGDIAVAGRAPLGGWRVRVGEDHTADSGPVVTLRSGGLATSGTTRRRWRRAGNTRHHVVDPRTGLPTAGPWRTVSVAAATCLDANTAATAALVLGADAAARLAAAGLPARLVGTDGRVTHVGGWV
ncbi:FAD:protein FMN transferase [Pseudonocardia xishanensis]|uniref:FAD:protein FMN transferase n=1 Tax=Pseudonocardia xishanensis TaxID=630995 RepID=A0ABP8S2W4_9PSEU